MNDHLGPSGPVQIFICRRGRHRPAPCVVCGKESSKLCDFPLRGAKAGKTCDRALCARCAVNQPGKDRDFCPTHAGMPSK